MTYELKLDQALKAERQSQIRNSQLEVQEEESLLSGGRCMMFII